jgi:hypothetical protein
MANESAFDPVRLEYEQINQNIRVLTEVRFKLLAFIPTVSGAAIALLGRSVGPQRLPPVVLAVVALLGFFVTLGVVFYDQRNSKLYDALIARASHLERAISSEAHMEGGQWSDRPPSTLYMFGAIKVWHDRGLALIYGSVLGAWVFGFVLGVVAHVRAPSPPFAGLNVALSAGLGGAAFVLFFIELSTLGTRDGRMWVSGLFTKRGLKQDVGRAWGYDERGNRIVQGPGPGDPAFDLLWEDDAGNLYAALVMKLPSWRPEEQLQFALRRHSILAARLDHDREIRLLLVLDRSPGADWSAWFFERGVRILSKDELGWLRDWSASPETYPGPAW